MGIFLSLIDDESFAFLLKKILLNYHFISITGIFQTISELEPVIYKCLEHLQNSFKDELQELGISKDIFQSFVFLFYTFKDLWLEFFYGI